MTDRRVTVLVVDDEAIIRLFVARVMEQEGHRVLVATSGSEALKIIDEQEPDLVISDINMPELSGLEMARGLRLDPGRSALPIIFLTASESFEDLQESVALDAFHFLHKPFSPEELAGVVRAALAARD